MTVSLYKGNIEVLAVESPFSMLKSELATFEASGDLFNHNASAGFIELHSLAQRTAYSIMKNKK